MDVAGRADGEPVPALPSRDVADSDKTIDAQRVAEGDAPALSPDVIPQPPGGIEAEIARIQAMRSAQQDSNLEQRGASPVAESQALPPSERSNLGVTPEQDGTAPILPTLAERLEAMRAKPNEAEADPVPYVAPQVQVTKPHPAFLRGSEALAEVSKSLGGISPDLLADLSERKVVTRTSKTGKQTQYITWDNPPAPGYGPLFRKGGTGDISEIARVLEEAGYIERGTMERHPQAGIRQAHDIIKAELREGGSTLAVGRTDAIDAAMRARHEAAMDEEPWDSFTFHPDDLETSGYHELDPAQRIETERLVREADGAGIDTERMKEDAARQTADDSDEAYHSAIQFAVRQALTESRSRTDGNDAKAASERDDGRGQVAIAPGEARGERATNRLDDAKGLTLAAHDAAELKAKTERESNAAALDKKAQIDREAEHFTLQADAPVEQRKDSTQSLFDAPRDDQERSNTREADTRIPARDAETQRVVEVRKRVSVLESVRKCLS